MSSTNVRVLGSITRLLLPASVNVGSRAVVTVATKVAAVPLKHQQWQTRELHNKSPAQQTTVVSSSSSSAAVQPQVAPLAAESGLYKLDDLKVFQDEQIVQLSFKSGLTVNYTMAWLRNLCSCPDCISNKFLAAPTPTHAPSSINQAPSIQPPSAEEQLSVARFSSTEDELVIEWLTTSDYKTPHPSKYSLKLLSLYAANNGRS